MRRFAGFVILLMAVAMPLAAPPSARAEDAGAADCNPLPDLIFNAAEPILREVAPGTARLHFVKDGSAQPGCPNAGQACAAPLFVIPGDPVVVTGMRGDFACATFTGPAPKTISTSGWLPRAALVIAAPAAGGAQAGALGDWLGDWRSGLEQHIRVTRTPDDRITLDGEATWGARDPDRVKRGAVNTGDFVATVAIAGGHLAFLVGDEGKPLPYDSQRAKDESLCGLKFWRLGPYLVVADNLQCGGNNVTFTGIYRRTGKPS